MLVGVIALVGASIGLATPAVAAPTASFTASPNPAQIGQNVTFDASSSANPDGGTLTYAWDFENDGTVDATSASAQHAYPTPGSWTVVLTVSNAVGSNTAVKTVTVNDAPPVASITANPGRAQIGQSVTFDGSSSSDPDPGDGIAKYEWDLGNGSAQSGATATTSYSTPGDKTVRLTVTDKYGATNVATLVYHVNAKPVSKLTFAVVNPEPGQLPTVPIVLEQQVGFASLATDAEATNANNNNTIAKYEWFDQGGPFGGNNAFAIHAPFTSAGNKTVFLRVTDNEGAVSDATVESIATVRVDTRPVAKIKLSPETPVTGQEVLFTDASTDADGPALTNPSNGLVTKWEWDLDGDPNTGTDGFEQTGNVVTKSFATAGTKTVRLRATDGAGARSANIAKAAVPVQDSIPLARFSFDPKFPVPGQNVTFKSSSKASGPGKKIEKQEWDLNYDEVSRNFDVDAVGSDASHAYAGAGEKVVALRVTETGGGYAIEKMPVLVQSPSARTGPGGISGNRPSVIAMTVWISGHRTRRGARLSLLRVRAPAGAMVKLKCKGKCPVRSKRIKMKSRQVRFKRLERNLRAGTKIVIDATMDGFIGRRVVYKIRKGKDPRRKDRCIQPGAEQASACPVG